MKIAEALKSLENSWSREDVLLKIKNGEDSENIVNEFCNSNKAEIITLTNFIKEEDEFLIKEIEDLSICEAKLIKKIKNYKLNENNASNVENNQKQILKNKQSIPTKLSLFMIKWSNKFVFISLLVISVIALTKQAWA